MKPIDQVGSPQTRCPDEHPALTAYRHLLVRPDQRALTSAQAELRSARPGSDETVGDQQDPPGAHRGNRRCVGRHLQPPQGELRRGRGIAPDPRGRLLAARSVRRNPGVKSTTRRSSGTSMCFGVSPPRITLSELAMISTPPPDRVGVQVPGRQEHRLVRVQVDPVHQQGGEYAGVARIELPDLGRRPGELPDSPASITRAGRCDHVADDLALCSSQAQQPTEHQPSRSTAGTRAHPPAVRPARSPPRPRAGKQRVRRGGIAEAAQRLGLPQRAQSTSGLGQPSR